MKINNEEVNIEDLYDRLDLKSSFLKRRENGLLLNDHQVSVLKNYHIDYHNHANLSSLLFAIDQYLNDHNDIDSFALEEVYQQLQEIHYYQETNK